MNKLTFEDWMKKVDKIIESRVGLSSDDLPDVCYRDWYDDGISPDRAANRAIKSAVEY